MFLPVVLVLIAENVGHVRGVATMTDASVNKHTGRALIADGAATTLAGALRRLGHHDVRREHRRDGRDPRVLDGRVLGRRRRRDPARALAEGRRDLQLDPGRACSAA